MNQNEIPMLPFNFGFPQYLYRHHEFYTVRPLGLFVSIPMVLVSPLSFWTSWSSYPFGHNYMPVVADSVFPLFLDNLSNFVSILVSLQLYS
jgi:hypothetical protein